MSFELSVNNDRDEDEDDEQEEADREKELNGLLSNAFDDLSSVSSEEEEDDYNNTDSEQQNSNDKTNALTNGFDTSSKFLNYNKSNSNNYNKLSNWALPNEYTSTPKVTLKNNAKQRRFAINDVIDVIDEESHVFDNENDYCQNGIKPLKSSLENCFDHIKNDKENHFINDKSFSHTHVQFLLDENQKLNNEFLILQQRLTAASGDFEGLKFKYKELERQNGIKDNELARLEGRVKSLELQIDVEREAKEEYQRKLKVADSTIESLQYQLMELGKSDCLVRARETHEAVIEKMTRKHENEVILLKGEIDGLRKELDSKKKEIYDLNNRLTKLHRDSQENCFSSQLKEMIEMTRNLWEKEIKEKMENDMKSLLQKTQVQMTKNSEEEIEKMRKNWEMELQTEVSEVIRRLKHTARQSVTQPDQSSFVTLSFVPLIELWNHLEKSCHQKENILMERLQELREAKAQLDEALAESKLSSFNSSGNEILKEMKSELDKVKCEAEEMKHKLLKYKQHYYQSVKKHKNEIETLKSDFAMILHNKLKERIQ